MLSVPKSTTVVILQEYVPEYRVPFFEALARLLDRRGIQLVVAAGRPAAPQAQRNDESRGQLRYRPVPQREWRLLNRRVVFRATASARRGAQLVIMEQARRNADTYRLLLPYRPTRYALWGHGHDYTQDVGAVRRRLIALLTRRVDWFFAYTAAGADAVGRMGVPRDRITVVQNSTDTESLRSAMQALSHAKVGALVKELDLKGLTAVYVGALDGSKRLDLLVEAARRAWLLDQRFRLVVVGDGPLRTVIRSVGEVPWMKWVGHVQHAAIAPYLQCAEVMFNPGRVGLVAVDALTAGLPIVTVPGRHHAPELEYLESGRTVFFGDADPSVLAEKLVKLLRAPEQLSAARDACLRRAVDFSTTKMASNFAQGIMSALAR